MKIGYQGKLYYLSGTGPRATWGAADANGLHSGPAPAGLALVKGVRDCTIDSERPEIDASSRDSAPYEAVTVGLIKVPVNFKVIWRPTDPGQLAILKAYLSRVPATVPIAVLDDDSATVGATGWWADWAILKMSHAQNLSEGQIIDVSMKPGDPPSGVFVEEVIVSA